jgi:hypothetical protein
MTTIPALATIPVTDDGALTQRWADLLTPGPVGGRTLWLAWLRPDGTMLPVLIPIEGIPEQPRWDSLHGVADLHAQVAGLDGVDPEELHLTTALARPGSIGTGVDEADHEWRQVVEEMGESLELGCSFHLFDGRSTVQLLPRSYWPR